MVIREIDDENRRQNKVSITPKGNKILKESVKLLKNWEEAVFDESIIEKELLQKALKDIAIKTIELNQKGE